MFRRIGCGALLQAVTSGAGAGVAKGTPLNSQQEVLQFDSAVSLLRACYRSIDITVKSRHARNFLKKRLIEQWAEKSKETDPQKQRLYMDLAGSFLQALHSDRTPSANKPVHFQLSRRVAYEQKMQERLAQGAAVKTRRRVPHDAKIV